jgi:hypothetical protein
VTIETRSVTESHCLYCTLVLISRKRFQQRVSNRKSWYTHKRGESPHGAEVDASFLYLTAACPNMRIKSRLVRPRSSTTYHHQRLKLNSRMEGDHDQDSERPVSQARIHHRNLKRTRKTLTMMDIGQRIESYMRALADQEVVVANLREQGLQGTMRQQLEQANL